MFVDLKITFDLSGMERDFFVLEQFTPNTFEWHHSFIELIKGHLFLVLALHRYYYFVRMQIILLFLADLQVN